MASSIWGHIYHLAKKISKSEKHKSGLPVTLHTIWTSGISTKTKINLFKTCVESILLYGSETRTMSKQLEKRLDGTYTRLLMRVQNINWKQHFTQEQIYGNLPKTSDVVRMRRNCFGGHCLRAKEEIISVLLFWSPPHQKRARKPLSYPETLVRDNDTDIPDLVNIMENRNLSGKDLLILITTVVAGSKVRLCY